MSPYPTDEAPAEAEALRKENCALKDQLARLREASIYISENLGTEAVLQDVIDSASKLTCARYGALLTFQPSGDVRDVYTCGLSQKERVRMTQSPQSLGLLGYLSRAKGPIRLKDLATHTDALSLPEPHPPMKTFLGMPIYHRSEHVGNLYLAGKKGGEEFSQEDEDAAATIAAQAASAIYNSRRY